MEAIRFVRSVGLFMTVVLGAFPLIARATDSVRRLPATDRAAPTASAVQASWFVDVPSSDLSLQLASASPTSPTSAETPSAGPSLAAVPEPTNNTVSPESLLPTLLPQNPATGYKEGFFIRTPDGKNLIRLQGAMQFRYNANWRDSNGGTQDEFEGGFTVNRVGLVAIGNFLSPKCGYYILVDAVHTTGDAYVPECKLSYAFNDTWMIGAGRIRNPAFLREMDVSFARQLGVERSYLEAILGLGVSEGVLLTRQTECTRTNIFLNDGRNASNPGMDIDYHGDPTDLALSLGVDYKLCGDWAQYGDFTSWPDQDWGMFIGTGFHWEEGETGDDVLANNLGDFVAWTMDATLEGHGFNLYVAGVGRHWTNDERNVNQYGLLAQGGYQIVPDKWEPYVRYEYISFDHRITPAGPEVPATNLNLISFGINRYFARHAAKITTELTYAANPVPVSISRMGLLADPVGGELSFRTQLQLVF